MDIREVIIPPKILEKLEQKHNVKEEIPESFVSLEEAGEFWDTHSAADYADLLHEVHFNVQIDKVPQYIHLEREIAMRVFNMAKNSGTRLPDASHFEPC